LIGDVIMKQGWIKLHRVILEHPTASKDADYFSVWIYLLLEATHKELETYFKGEKKTLKPGQLLTGRKSISSQFNISESKVQRILKAFENEQLIEQETSNKNRLITILNWDRYQSIDIDSEQQMNNKRTTDEHLVNTNKNVRTNNNIYISNEPQVESIKIRDQLSNFKNNNNSKPSNLDMPKKQPGESMNEYLEKYNAWFKKSKEEQAKRIREQDNKVLGFRRHA